MKFLIYILLAITNFTYSQSSPFDFDNVLATVLLEKKVGDQYLPHGTGVALGDERYPEMSWVVTNRHL